MGQASVFKMLDPSRMEQKNESLFGLVEFPFFPAQIQAHIQPLFERIFKGRCWRRSTVDPQCSNSNGCGMPTESAGDADVRFVQRFLEEDVDGEVGAGHTDQHHDPFTVLQ